MPLQNRVAPDGELFADPARGLLMGNRGGRLHDPDTRVLTRRRWTSRAWIACRLDFKGRHRTVWGEGYTELFFCDEPTALAAGHRPCFECRRAEASAFVAAAAAGLGRAARFTAPDIDRLLHAERRDGRVPRSHPLPLDALPDGAMLRRDGRFFAVRGDALLPWSFAGYAGAEPRPRGLLADVLTPPTALAALRAGYAPLWHPSAGVTSAAASPAR